MHILSYLIASNVTGEAELRLDLPDSITTWMTEAIGLSAEKGLGLAQTAELHTFKPFFIDFTLPYSVIRGEQTKVPLTVYNYLSTCAEVRMFSLILEQCFKINQFDLFERNIVPGPRKRVDPEGHCTS